MQTKFLAAGAVATCLIASIGARDSVAAPPATATPAPLADWPRIPSPVARDAALEARIARIVAGMTLAEKIGQMTQPEIKSITPEQVGEYHIGSVLNGGGSWPAMDKHASIGDWLRLAERYHQASMSAPASTPIPVLWGTDAVHGHNNVFGATLFPHNIGLGAAHDPGLVREIGRATAAATRATGIHWVFGPTLAVAQDMRWGRSYESFSSEGALVREYAAAYVDGLQNDLRGNASVVATAKHYIGDGATAHGKDQGNAEVTRAEMINVHGQGYYGALGAGVQTVMASFNSWHDVAAGVDYGKMHGAAPLLDEALKQKMGFDGFVISDWNGIGQVKGCTNASCPQAILAGVDMIMVPDEWKAFIANTMAQVEAGTIPMSRIDDAVARILRVKLRAGLFDQAPSQARDAGREAAVVHRDLARRAVRESLVLLKNERGALPLKRGQRVLVVGKSADSLANQAGGWSLTWQGTDNVNADYRNADSVLTGLRRALGEDHVMLDEQAAGDARGFDAVVAVIGETPYAEMMGDIQPWDVANHSRHHPEDLAVLQAARRAGKPVVTVFLSGRPLPANDLINLSDAFVAAWLPGSEGAGIADVLVADAGGKPRFDFRGRLSFPWPADPCPAPINRPDPSRPPQFALGYGLGYGAPASVGRLPETDRAACGDATLVPVFNTGDVAPYVLHVATAEANHALGAALNGTLAWPQAQPVVQVRTVQVNTQQDAREVTWLAPARLEARSSAPQDLGALAKGDGALQFDVMPMQAPTGPVQLAMACGAHCGGGVDIGPVLAALPAGKKATLKVPLRCFTERGVNLASVDAPFSLQAQAPFAAAFTRIVVVAGAGRDADALPCAMGH